MRGAVETVARLRAEISAEIQIGLLRAYASADSPEVRRADQELAVMRRELARLESGGGVGEARGRRAPAAGVPAASATSGWRGRPSTAS